jgi:hypothetical protein
MRYRLRTLLIVLALGPPLLAGFVFFGPQMVWDGGFDLSVHFVNNTGRSIDRIYATRPGSKSDMELYVSFPEREHPTWKPIEMEDSGLAHTHLNCSGHVSLLIGHELSYWQPEAIALRVDFADGSQSIFAVDVPGRGKRDVDVDIPAPNR